MAWISARLERLREVVANCVKKGLDPTKTGFSDFVINYISANYGLRPKTAREHVRTLIDAYNFNRWASYLKHNDYISKEEAEEWIRQRSK